jgi:hypothetical protein
MGVSFVSEGDELALVELTRERDVLKLGGRVAWGRVYAGGLGGAVGLEAWLDGTCAVQEGDGVRPPWSLRS